MPKKIIYTIQFLLKNEGEKISYFVKYLILLYKCLRLDNKPFFGNNLYLENFYDFETEIKKLKIPKIWSNPSQLYQYIGRKAYFIWIQYNFCHPIYEEYADAQATSEENFIKYLKNVGKYNLKSENISLDKSVRKYIEEYLKNKSGNSQKTTLRELVRLKKNVKKLKYRNQV